MLFALSVLLFSLFQETVAPTPQDISHSTSIDDFNVEVLGDEKSDREDHPLQIVVPDTDPIQITFRPKPSFDPDSAFVESIDNGTDPDFYGALKQLAEDGYAHAAFRLSQSLVDCLGVAETREELKTDILQLYQTRTIPMTGPAVKRFGNIERVIIAEDANPFEYEAILKNQFLRCEGVSESMKKEADRWLEVSAELGSVEGLQIFASEIQTTDTVRAKNLYERLWQQGHVEATGSLARLFESGGEGMEADPIAAYAYGYVYLELFRLSRDATGQSDSHSLQQLWNKGLAVRERRERMLMPNDLQKANDLARDLLTSNDNCCYHLFSTSSRRMIINRGPAVDPERN